MIFHFLLLALACVAEKVELTANAAEYCTGMYSRQDWGGPVDPFIKVDVKKFSKNPDDTHPLSLVVFEYRDMDYLGTTDNVTGVTNYICTDKFVREDVCPKSELNQFIVSSNNSGNSLIKTAVLTELGTNDFSYHVANTGYYCLAVYDPQYSSSEGSFSVIVNFHNAFGNLPASEIPKLPLYGLLAVVYAVCLSVYLFQVFKHRSELLLLQKYLAGFFVFLTVENILVWSLYDVENNNKTFPIPNGIKFYISFISMLNAFRVSFSLFLLLIISLGYGVVYPKLQRKTMNKCKLLAAAHFLVSTVFIWFSYYSSQVQPSGSTTNTSKATTTIEANSWVILIITLPLAVLLVVFYFLILTSLQKTVKLLAEKKQIVKLKMYKNLFKLIFGSMLLMVFALIINVVLVFNDSLTESIERLWKFSDVLTDFWPACIYFIVFIGLAIIWRPTDSSYLLAASSQIPTADNGDADPEEPQEIYNNLDQYGNEFEFDDLRSLNSDNPFGDPPESLPTPENPFDDPVQKPSGDNFKIDDDEEEQEDKEKTDDSKDK
ncbi:hypothetical protein OGAPHI_007226 [Ogataea philodendri]|uniref:Membrane protein PTM1 n=1 Tax=Ogataea philodendri TaxID=1378263 RepID=A0A9P8SZY4_9ASCO|nr:uncharacterized protein OGAPHI_007226 [Ogataea philodendri]KAH3660021.1 hypothetical protein OGAPHI_007226 [Ogataea philodendri]